MTLVKICGITREDDIFTLLRYRIWALGFIQIEESPRYIQPEKAREMVCRLPSQVLSVGVFRDQSVREIKQIRNYCGFSLVQLHGKENSSYCAQLGKGVIRAFGIGEELDFRRIQEYISVVDYFLFDTLIRGRSGGTGQPFSWNLLKGIERLNKPFLVAGGLSSDNVEACINAIHPFAVDVNSGVESSPGKKDREKTKALFQKLNTF